MQHQSDCIVSSNSLILLKKTRFWIHASECAAMPSELVAEDLRRGGAAAGGSVAVRRRSWRVRRALSRRGRWAGWTSRRPGTAGRRSRRRRVSFAACASSCGRCRSSASREGASPTGDDGGDRPGGQAGGGSGGDAASERVEGPNPEQALITVVARAQQVPDTPNCFRTDRKTPHSARPNAPPPLIPRTENQGPSQQPPQRTALKAP